MHDKDQLFIVKDDRKGVKPSEKRLNLGMQIVNASDKPVSQKQDGGLEDLGEIPGYVRCGFIDGASFFQNEDNKNFIKGKWMYFAIASLKNNKMELVYNANDTDQQGYFMRWLSGESVELAGIKKEYSDYYPKDNQLYVVMGQSVAAQMGISLSKYQWRSTLVSTDNKVPGSLRAILHPGAKTDLMKPKSIAMELFNEQGEGLGGLLHHGGSYFSILGNHTCSHDSSAYSNQTIKSKGIVAHPGACKKDEHNVTQHYEDNGQAVNIKSAHISTGVNFIQGYQTDFDGEVEFHPYKPNPPGLSNYLMKCWIYFDVYNNKKWSVVASSVIEPTSANMPSSWMSFPTTPGSGEPPLAPPPPVPPGNNPPPPEGEPPVLPPPIPWQTPVTDIPEIGAGDDDVWIDDMPDIEGNPIPPITDPVPPPEPAPPEFPTDPGGAVTPIDGIVFATPMTDVSSGLSTFEQLHPDEIQTGIPAKLANINHLSDINIQSIGSSKYEENAALTPTDPVFTETITSGSKPAIQPETAMPSLHFDAYSTDLNGDTEENSNVTYGGELSVQEKLDPAMAYLREIKEPRYSNNGYYPGVNKRAGFLNTKTLNRRMDGLQKVTPSLSFEHAVSGVLTGFCEQNADGTLKKQVIEDQILKASSGTGGVCFHPADCTRSNWAGTKTTVADFVFLSERAKIAFGTPNSANYDATIEIKDVAGDKFLNIDISNISGIIINGLPTSSAGLPSGALWCDTTAGNVIKQV